MRHNLYITILSILCVAGFFMSVSEGSPYFWANIVGLFLFGGTSYLLGLFKNPHERMH